MSVRRQRLCEQTGDLINGGILAHRNPKESKDDPQILRPPCAGETGKVGLNPEVSNPLPLGPGPTPFRQQVGEFSYPRPPPPPVSK